jgi:HPt (histidine-containing phosphotransfer) domain-containing protein
MSVTVLIIPPELALAVKLGPGKGIDPAVLERAEQAVAAMAHSYLEWAAKDVGRLQAAVGTARPLGEAASLEELRAIAHEVRGQGGSFGFPLISRVATSLYRLLRESEHLSAEGFDIVEAHVEALRAVVAQRVKGDGGSTGQQLAGELEAMVERQLADPA